MGGKLIQQIYGLPEKRVPRAEFDRLVEKVSSVIQNHFPHRRVEVVPFYKDKQDFGDVDLLVESFSGDQINWFEFIEKNFNYKPHKNGSVYSFPVEGFQIDLILTPFESFNCAKDYYSCETGNFMGRIADKLGFKYGHNGLWLHVSLNYFHEDLPDHEYRDILITKNPEHIFFLLGFDYKQFQQGFDTLSDMFFWVAASKYFNPELFAFDELNSINRTRNRKRPVYANFVKWCASQPPREMPDREYMFNYVYIRYGHISEEIRKIKLEVLQNKERREKFNGNLVKEILNLEGKELGDYIMSFKKNFSVNGNFEEWLDRRTPYQVIQAIQSSRDSNNL